MKFDLDRQETGCSELVLDGSLELGLPAGWPVAARLAGTLKVQDLESRVILNGIMQATGRADCAGCLEEFEIHWDVPVYVMILRDVECDGDEGEMLLIRQRTGEVDLRDSLRECAVLTYPQAPLCKPDCKGLCPDCGINRNQGTCECSENEIDPRWEGLP